MPLPNLIDGRAIAEQIHAETSHRLAALKDRGVQPGLVFVRPESPVMQIGPILLAARDLGWR